MIWTVQMKTESEFAIIKSAIMNGKCAQSKNRCLPASSRSAFLPIFVFVCTFHSAFLSSSFSFFLYASIVVVRWFQCISSLCRILLNGLRFERHVFYRSPHTSYLRLCHSTNPVAAESFRFRCVFLARNFN